MANIGDVALKAGVSKTTVSRVINNFSPVNTETRLRVVAAMKALDYTPSVIAQGMRNQRTKSVGVLIPDFRSYWYAELLNYLEDEARARGYLVIISSTHADHHREIEYVNELVRRQVDGLILCWYKETREKTKVLKDISRKIPIVLMDQPAKGFNASSVYTDGYTGIKKLTKALIKQGHRKIAMVVEDRQYSAHERRFQGYCDALRECGAPIDMNLVVENEIGFKSGYDGANKLLSREKPTAIVTIDDLTAVGVLECCHDRMVKVPEEMTVTGFDDIPISQFCSPRLTTISQPVQDLARNAIEIAIRKIQNERARNQELVFEPRIILRESSTLTEGDLE
jgi:DNA-binding LacI/PurR family transcriptional regulator